jgi:DNA-3-methyladenine glycosylase II
LAARLKAKLVEHCGRRIDVNDVSMAVLPSPSALLEAEPMTGLPTLKWDRLQAMARAAAAGELDADRLRAGKPEDVLAKLCELPGVGPWTAAHILLRGAGTPDLLPLGEPRLHAAVKLVYGLRSDPTDEQLEEIAESWRPLRTWIAVLVVMKLFREGKARVDRTKRGRKTISSV